MFIDELKKQFTPEQVEAIRKILQDAVVDYDKENGCYPESVWQGASIYQFLTGINIRKGTPNDPGYYFDYWL